MSDLRPEVLSWTALLGRWIDYARASLALPDDAEGSRWKQSVVSVINLQAATFALGELTELPWNDQAVAVDRADVLIDAARGVIDAIWQDVEQPQSLREIVDDARGALELAAVIVGGWELRWEGTGVWVMPIVDLPQRAGTLLVMMPGSLVMPGEPVAWGRCAALLEIAGCKLVARDQPRQVYRLMDDAGTITGDVVAVIDDDDPPAGGLPLLVPIVVEGKTLGDFPMEADEWLARQRAGLGDVERIAVSVVT